MTSRRALRRLRAMIATGDRAGALRVVDRMAEPPLRRSLFGVEGQLVLRFATFHCHTLDAVLQAHVCVTRQKVNDVQRTQQASRGQGTDYPSCCTRTCEQGRRIRNALDPGQSGRWRGVGPGGRFGRDRPASEREAQRAVQRRMHATGLLDDVPTIDADLAAVEE